jgi:hypothetical protein
LISFFFSSGCGSFNFSVVFSMIFLSSVGHKRTLRGLDNLINLLINPDSFDNDNLRRRLWRRGIKTSLLFSFSFLFFYYFTFTFNKRICFWNWFLFVSLSFFAWFDREWKEIRIFLKSINLHKLRFKKKYSHYRLCCFSHFHFSRTDKKFLLN